MSIGTLVRHIARLLLVRVRGSGPRPEPGGELTYRTSPYTLSAKFKPRSLHEKALHVTSGPSLLLFRQAGSPRNLVVPNKDALQFVDRSPSAPLDEAALANAHPRI